MDRKKQIILQIRHIIDMGADGASVHDLNKFFYNLRAATESGTEKGVRMYINCFRSAMSRERTVFSRRPQGIIELWDLLDELLREMCSHPKEQRGKVGKVEYCKLCMKENP